MTAIEFERKADERHDTVCRALALIVGRLDDKQHAKMLDWVARRDATTDRKERAMLSACLLGLYNDVVSKPVRQAMSQLLFGTDKYTDKKR